MAEGLNLHNVTDLVVNSLESTQQLNTVTLPEADRIYSEHLATTLTRSEFARTGLSGAYFHIYTPVLEGREYPDVAVKMMTPSTSFQAALLERFSRAPEAEIQEIVDIPGFIQLEGRTGMVLIADLTPEECQLVMLAKEHLDHQEIFPGFVLPAVFVSFTLKKDILGNIDFSQPETLDFAEANRLEIIADLRSDGRYSEETGRAIEVKGGSRVYAMVQNFVINDPILEFGKSPDLKNWTPDMINQVECFADLIDVEYRKTGRYPDRKMLREGNLGFSKTGKLILVDTNSLFQDDNEKRDININATDNDDRPSGILSVVDKLRSYAQKARSLQSK